MVLYFNTYSIFHYIVSLHIILHILFLRIVQVGNNVSHHTWWEPVVAFPTVIFSQFYVSHNYFIILTHVMSDQEGVKRLDSICCVKMCSLYFLASLLRFVYIRRTFSRVPSSLNQASLEYLSKPELYPTKLNLYYTYHTNISQ